MPQDRVLDFGRHPHAAARTVLLEVTFIQTPQFDVGMTSQTSEFFLLPRLLADPIGDWVGAYVPKAQFSKKSLTLPHTDLHCISPTQVFRQHRPSIAWPPDRSLAGSCGKSDCNLRILRI